MYRLGLRLTLKGGREALTRLLLTMVAVAVGVAVLLGVLADFHAYQKTSNRPSWESTTGVAVTDPLPTNKNALLWNYSENIYKGQFIEQLNIAALGSNAPILPGISKLPSAGQFYASPALARLLQTVSKDELGNRFPGKMVGTIGESGLAFPTELAIFEGYAPQQLANASGTSIVTQIATSSQLQGTTNIYREAFGVAAVVILFPLLILVNTATRLSAARREERYAAMRLIGATPRQINVVASVDAIVGSLLGAIFGSIVFLLVRPAVADISFSGVKFFPNYVTPTVWGYVGMIILIPVIAAIASLLSLRRVQISPLGVSRKSASPKPRAWRLLPLAVGAAALVFAAKQINPKSNSGPGLIILSFLLIMIGLVLSGSWLVMQASKLLARSTRSASSLLAARRLNDNPKGAFRSISGLILAVFVGSFIAVLVPALNAAQSPTSDTSLNSVLRVPYNVSPTDDGLPAADGAALIAKLHSYSGTTVLPLYANPSFIAFQTAQLNAQNQGQGVPQHMVGGSSGNKGGGAAVPDDTIADCASLKQLDVIGSCAPGVQAVTFDSSNLLGGDNPLEIYKSLPIVTSNSPSISVNTKNLQLAGLLVKTNNANTLEKIRTYLTTYNASTNLDQGSGDGNSLTSWEMGVFEPETIGEVAAIRNNDDTNVERAVLAIIALTLITAGCSLAVTVGGSLVERKRPFTLLRVSGVSLSTLYKVILLEAALPLVVVSAIAAGIGIGIGVPVVKSLLKSVEPKDTTYPVHPSEGFYIALGIGLVVSLGLVVITLPLLKRMTKPEDARFE